MRALGLCGTDLHLYGGRGTTYPHVVGHDGAGSVHAVGDGVAGLTIGQRVTIDPVTHCGQCANCRRGAVRRCCGAGSRRAARLRSRTGGAARALSRCRGLRVSGVCQGVVEPVVGSRSRRSGQ
ncbi:alcohol dehydrogenase catalytic domain-containing protein, partial [Streptomyces sp. NPDC005474]|uniref:alcohol dehydrogenase catalytic domain-containing protein n=1 Tax=Streptomyces sp. NPDC005474 TaxID=3154878 RepID=UPI003451761A